MKKIEKADFFVSYNYGTKDGLTGFGCTTFHYEGSNSKIENFDDIIYIADDVKKKNPEFKNVVILNIQRLPI